MKIVLCLCVCSVVPCRTLIKPCTTSTGRTYYATLTRSANVGGKIPVECFFHSAAFFTSRLSLVIFDFIPGFSSLPLFFSLCLFSSQIVRCTQCKWVRCPVNDEFFSRRSRFLLVKYQSLCRTAVSRFNRRRDAFIYVAWINNDEVMMAFSPYSPGELLTEHDRCGRKKRGAQLFFCQSVANFAVAATVVVVVVVNCLTVSVV